VSRTAVALERLAIALASLALSVGLIALLSGYFAGHDAAGVAGSAIAPGQPFADLGHRHLLPGQPASAYDSVPPTSGAHHVVAITRDQSPLSDDQLLTALEAGDVVVLYPPPRPPAALRTLAAQLAPTFSPGLAAAGQALILAPRLGVKGLVALGWAHLFRAGSATDPGLAQFITYWLGRGATSH
jgi:uncharacterized protein DUF3105